MTKKSRTTFRFIFHGDWGWGFGPALLKTTKMSKANGLFKAEAEKNKKQLLEEEYMRHLRELSSEEKRMLEKNKNKNASQD